MAPGSEPLRRRRRRRWQRQRRAAVAVAVVAAAVAIVAFVAAAEAADPPGTASPAAELPIKRVDVQGDPVSTSLIIINGFLVFFMQVGFVAFETGSGRAKNVRNILLKNLLDVMLAAVAWWAVGYAFAYGRSAGGAVGTDLFFYEGGGGALMSDRAAVRPWFFSWTFCIAACTIISGCLAERTALSAYPLATLLIAAVVHPLLVHWVWSPDGWMARAVGGGECRVLDFAGGIVVHALGGVVGLVGAWKCGPRLGRFEALSEYGDGGGGDFIVVGGGGGGAGGGLGEGGGAYELDGGGVMWGSQQQQQQQQQQQEQQPPGDSSVPSSSIAGGSTGRVPGMARPVGAGAAAGEGSSSSSSSAAPGPASRSRSAAFTAALRRHWEAAMPGVARTRGSAAAGGAVADAAQPSSLPHRRQQRRKPDVAGSNGVDDDDGAAAGWLACLGRRGRRRHGGGGGGRGCCGGRCGPRYVARAMPGHDMAFVTLGTFMLWFGWFGFNNGSVYMYVMSLDGSSSGGSSGSGGGGGSGAPLHLASAVGAEVVQRTSMNTALGGASGGLMALAVAALLSRTYDLRVCCNGVLSGLVTVTCMCGFVDPWAAVVCSGLAGALYWPMSALLLRCGVDDPLDSSVVHLGNGLLGTVLVAFVARPEHVRALTGSPCGGLFYGAGAHGWTQLWLQLLGAAVVVLFAGGAALLLFSLLARYGLLRVDTATELAGIDNVDHGGPAYPEAFGARSGGGGGANAAAAMSGLLSGSCADGARGGGGGNSGSNNGGGGALELVGGSGGGGGGGSGGAFGRFSSAGAAAGSGDGATSGSFFSAAGGGSEAVAGASPRFTQGHAFT